MAFIAPGFTFSDNVQDQFSATALAAFMASANVTAVAMAEMLAVAHVVQTLAGDGYTTPSSNQGEGSLWFDSTLNIFRQLDSTRWDCFYQGAEMKNNSSIIRPQGAWVVANGSNTVAPCATSAWPEVLGVLGITLASGMSGIVFRTGLAQARIRGPCTYGDVLVSASLADAFSDSGYAKSATMIAGYGNTTFTAGLEIGMALGGLGNTTGLITCMAWR